MLINDHYRLRLIEETDLTFLKNLRESPETSQYLGSFCMLNMARQKKWFEGLQNDSSKLFLMFEQFQESDWQAIGMVRISDIDLINRSMCVGGDICPEFRGKGHAPKMYDLIFRLGFDYYNMNRLWLLVLENNEPAKNLYKKMGFFNEGVQRQAIFKEGQYQDYIMMSLLRGEYENGR